MESAIPILVVLLVISTVLLCLLWRSHTRLLRTFDARVREARKQTADQSRRTIKGQIAEQMVPHLEGFEYAPKDARFVGDPIDYIVFNGLSDYADTRNEIEIVLLEIKQNQAQLKSAERAIAQAVAEGRVRFEVCRVSEDGSLSTDSYRPQRAKDAQERRAEPARLSR